MVTFDQVRALVRLESAMKAPDLYTNDELAWRLSDATEAFKEKE
jgi:hypothetical protein